MVPLTKLPFFFLFYRFYFPFLAKLETSKIKNKKKYMVFGLKKFSVRLFPFRVPRLVDWRKRSKRPTTFFFFVLHVTQVNDVVYKRYGFGLGYSKKFGLWGIKNGLKFLLGSIKMARIWVCMCAIILLGLTDFKLDYIHWNKYISIN